ncbi:MAG: cell division protein ZapE [Gammaproteobacteria bacterium]|nr:AFG1 family ATPase [Gammaproteobacteria bacterium]MCP5201446.1 cell division protein ZapE [Gammaproteobacteria bacterium]
MTMQTNSSVQHIPGTPPATPAARYAGDLAAGRIRPDDAQATAVAALQRVFDALAASPARREAGLVDRLLGRSVAPWQGVRGLYLWGRVGRGKTYLVDTFYECLPAGHKARVHFHHFMRRTHQALRSLGEQRDPLKTIAARWAEEHRVLCLDEFHVSDITDAMLLAGLLEALFEAGVTLIATSNEAPGELYAGGLQRERFLPAIALIESHLEVLELAGELDYRLRALEQAPVYYVAAAAGADAELAQRFDAVAASAGRAGAVLEVEGRDIPTLRLADGVAWFSFDVLCGGPRATADYIEIARCHHTVFLSDIPRLGRDDGDAARRFINLIDEIYDRNVNLVVSAADEPEALYTGERLAKPFLRTASRLREMRSHDYLARPHLGN